MEENQVKQRDRPRLARAVARLEGIFVYFCARYTDTCLAVTMSRLRLRPIIAA